MRHALIVDDDIDTLRVMTELVRLEGFTVDNAQSLREARICMVRKQPDIVLLDHGLPDGDGTELFADIGSNDQTQIVLITGNASIETSVQALRMGATDYLIKPVSGKQIKSILSRVAQPIDLKNKVRILQDELHSAGRFGHLLGSSAVMQKVYDQIARVGPTAASVMIIGQSGTGKELVAQTVHDLSSRHKAPFIAVNCGAISTHLIESEMFGHEKGSFTGASREHKGYFERANGGTLFLDEVTEMPIDLQVKLLRVLETGAFMRVGSDRETETDVRVIAATNRIPEEAVEAGKLREDLLYRLQVFPIHMPPLSARGDDLTLLATKFLNDFNTENSTAKEFAKDTLARLKAHHWPGNVRELKNVVHRAYIMADEIIGDADLPLALGNESSTPTGPVFTIRVGMSVAEVEKLLLFATLAEFGGNKERAAEVLGVSLKTLYNRLRDYAGKDAASVSDAVAENDQGQ